ncbi:MAG: hypothetical protein ACE5GH_07590 [Fidelibacterota bacterium]
MSEEELKFSTPEAPRERQPILRQYRKVFLLWGALAAIIVILLLIGVDKKAIALLTILLGLLTKAFAGLGALISLVPVVGPLIVKVLTIPFFWILNGLGYFVSVIAIKRGYSKEVIHSRVLTIALLVGILLGYILGYLFPLR